MGNDDLIGKRFGHIKVVEQIDKRYFKCRCDCGNNKTFRKDHIIQSDKLNCGCVGAKKREDKWVGKKFDKLTIIKLLENRKCICVCDCGNETTVYLNNLGRNNTLSCGCEFKIKAGVRHGLLKDYMPEYRSWSQMKNRCLNKNTPGYLYYGNTKICDEWVNSFEVFLNDVGERPHPKEDYSLDRINNNEGYNPNNCKWSTREEQANNRRKKGTVKTMTNKRVA